MTITVNHLAVASIAAASIAAAALISAVGFTALRVLEVRNTAWPNVTGVDA